MAMTEKYIHYIFTTAEQSKRKQKTPFIIIMETTYKCVLIKS